MQLGQRARDKVTGMTGVLIARAQHLNGCERWLLQPILDKDGKMLEAYWFDEVQLEPMDQVIQHTEVKTGGLPSRHS